MGTEQRTNLKFLVRLGKTPSEALRLLQQVYGDETMSRSQVFEWHKRFKEGRNDVEDNPSSWRPSMSRTEANVERVRQVVRSDCRLTVRLSQVSWAWTATVSGRLSPKIWVCGRSAQRWCRRCWTMTRRSGACRCVRTFSSVLKPNQTCWEESSIFEYDPKTKNQSLQWKSPESPRQKKARQSQSKVKLMLIAFFDVRGIVHMEFLLQGQTINQHVYKEILRCLLCSVLKKRRELWQDNSWLLHHDNAPAHNALNIRQFLVEKNIAMLEQLPYSPDLAPCDFFLFPKLKGVVKGTRFPDVEAIKRAVTTAAENPGRILPEVHGGVAEKDGKVC